MRIVIERDLRVPARDGVLLAADLYRPDTRAPLPTVLHRTPYGKAVYSTASAADALRIIEAGYNLLVQDTRGRFGSGGRFQPLLDEGRDGVDTIRWTAGQPWSDGRVGTLGRSYGGATQWLAAAHGPDELRAMVPDVTGDDFYQGWTYQGGAFQLGFCLHWTLSDLVLPQLQQRRPGPGGQAPGAAEDELVRRIDRIDELYRQPWRALRLLDGPAPWYREWLCHPSYDEHWRRLAPKERYGTVRAPALHIGGWYDIFLAGTIGNFVGMRRQGADAAARSGQRLLIGPWSHCVGGGVFPQRCYGHAASAAAADLTAAHLRWFDQHLRQAAGTGRDAPVRLFVMGADVWRDFDDWPPPDAVPTRLYLHSAGGANSARGDGALSPEPPGEEEPDAYLYDPGAPVPTLGGATLMAGMEVGADCGPLDQRPVEVRGDVLCYTSERLERPLAVIGPVTLVLYAESSAVDTDFTAKLVDVGADGRAEILCDGILRARYRESLSTPRPLRPGTVAELHVDLGATANVFAAGHRLRLEVSSSNFPRFDVNPNTGGPSLALERQTPVPALNQVHHRRAHPSHLVLHVLRPGPGPGPGA